MNIKISDLEKICAAMLNHLRNQGMEELQINKNLYWSISVAERSMIEKPELRLGDLDFDIELLQAVIDEEDPAQSFHFERLGIVLGELSKIENYYCDALLKNHT